MPFDANADDLKEAQLGFLKCQLCSVHLCPQLKKRRFDQMMVSDVAGDGPLQMEDNLDAKSIHQSETFKLLKLA